jgi:hypothetical protein
MTGSRAVPVAPFNAWLEVDHACRTCGARVMQAAVGGAFRCLTCGAGAPTVEGVCGCGVRSTNTGLRFRCTPNPRRGPGSVALVIIIRADGAPSEPN